MVRMFNFTTENCKNCYKCVRNCPVKAIKFKNGKAKIEEDKCIACGRCFSACPKNARNVENDVATVMSELKSGSKVIACIDSAYLAAFDDPKKFIAGLKKMGFFSVSETAVGSEIVTEQYIKHINENPDKKYFLSSSCPTIYLFVTKYYPELVPYLVPVVSPMIALGKALKKEDPDCYTVYIGPCLSRKYETLPKDKDAYINAIITFVEIIRMMKMSFIDMDSLEPEVPDQVPRAHGENYSISGDMWSELRKTLKNNNYDILSVDGMENVKNIFDSMVSGALDRAYIGISACSGSCINGPFMTERNKDIYLKKQELRRFAKHCWDFETPQIDWSDIDLSCSFEDKHVVRGKASKAEIEEILGRMDKHSRIDELDCGACGYESCREKAQAVFEGMAEVEMCMPYMRSKAESMSDVIFLNARNAILIIDDELRITQINPVAVQIFGKIPYHVCGKPVSLIMDDRNFKEAFETKRDIMNKKIYLGEYKFVGMMNIMHIKNQNKIIASIQDITIEEKHRVEIEKLKLNTLEIAQNVIEKQMRVAQEIASLLGETTAETKVALNKLKDVVLKEGE